MNKRECIIHEALSPSIIPQPKSVGCTSFPRGPLTWVCVSFGYSFRKSRINHEECR